MNVIPKVVVVKSCSVVELALAAGNLIKPIPHKINEMIV